MASQEIIDVVAIITPKKDKWPRVVEVLHDLAESVKSEEDGTTKYQVFQDRSQGDELVVLEQYKDRAAFESHGNSDHFQKAGQIMAKEELLAKPLDIKVLGALAGFASK